MSFSAAFLVLECASMLKNVELSKCLPLMTSGDLTFEQGWINDFGGGGGTRP